jgi:hypothetical protein
MPPKKVHMISPIESHPNLACCSWNDNRTLTITTRPHEVTCKLCLQGMGGSYRVRGEYAELFDNNRYLQIKYVY